MFGPLLDLSNPFARVCILSQIMFSYFLSTMIRPIASAGNACALSFGHRVGKACRKTVDTTPATQLIFFDSTTAHDGHGQNSEIH